MNKKNMAIGEYRAYFLLWTRWYTANMNDTMLQLPHTLAVLAVGSTLVYGYDLWPIHDNKKYYVQQ